MAEFAYHIVGASGHQNKATVNAPTREAALNILRAQDGKLLSIHEVKPKKKSLKLGGKKVGIKELVIFTRELSTMIDAGVPLPRGLSTLSDQTENKTFKVIVRSVTHDIESGIPLADGMAKFPDVFSDVYVNMVRAGEAGGILNDILQRLATQVEKDAAIRSKIRAAMAYPLVILTVTIVAFFGIMLFIMPKISKIILDLGGPGAKLPVYSRVMIGISTFMQHHFVFILIGMVGSIWGFRHYVKTDKGKYRWHGLLLKAPVLGKIIAKIAIARFARTFASLMGSGVSVLESLEITGKAVGNVVIQKELGDIAEAVKNGQPLGKQILAAPFFPPIVGQMMSVGEETGKIDTILLKVADFYEQEVDSVIDSLASIIEPVMIILLGGIVGLIAASVMGPIAGLSKQIGG